MLKVSDNTAANKAIFITGSARGGTTIVGKLIHSFSGVEYEFEPPALVALFSQIDAIEKDSWKLVYEAYLSKTILENSVLGRTINCNEKDDSSIYLVKDREEIEQRLVGSFTPTNSVIAYKIPSMINILPKLIEYYPQTDIVLVERSADEVINSLLEKKWFSKNDVLWPYEQISGEKIPFWVKGHDEWLSMSEIDRCAYYYLAMVGGREIAKCCINYSELLKDPEGATKSIAAQLGLEFGAKTNSLISSIQRRSARKTEILDEVSPLLRKKINSLALLQKNEV